MRGVPEVHKPESAGLRLPKPKAQAFADNHAEAAQRGPVQRLSDVHDSPSDVGALVAVVTVTVVVIKLIRPEDSK